jgi:hypothetical protein
VFGYIALSTWTGQFHAGFKGAAFESEHLGGAPFASHTPTGRFQDLKDMHPFGLLQGLRARERRGLLRGLW